MALFASVGYVGYVQLGNFLVRATSCGIKTEQSIDYPNVVDGRVDRTIYQMGPKMTGGSVSFPLIHENTGTGTVCIGETGKNDSQQPDPSNSLISYLWDLAAARDSTGRLTPFNANVRYYTSLSYEYPSCYINEFGLSVNQGANIDINLSVMGGAAGVGSTTQDRIRNIGDPNGALDYLSPARTATWNDFAINLYIPGAISEANGGRQASGIIQGQELISFNVNLQNNLQRFFTLNGTLQAFDIAANKRAIGGDLTIMGHNEFLTNYAYSNDSRYTSAAAIAFGVKIGGPNAQPYWATSLQGVIFEIETVELSLDLFKTSTKWTATGSCLTDYSATNLGGNFPLSSQVPGKPDLSPITYSG
jgi:Phage tail tube protein